MLKLPISLPFDLSRFRVKKPDFQLVVPTRSFVGVDIGTSAVKVVELSKAGERIKLENYGAMKASAAYEKRFRTLQKSTLFLPGQDLAKTLKAIFEEADIRTRSAVFSLPDFSTFFTTFELPPLSSEEITQAVEYEARQHVPLPLQDITLDWQITGGRLQSDKQEGTPLKVLLVAVPNEVVEQYQQVASLANINLTALEAEVFSFARAVASYEEGIVVLVDVGAQSTTVSIVEKGMVRMSHSFDIGGNEFTRRVSQALNVEYGEAERMKIAQGLERSLKEKEEQGVSEQAQKAIPKDVLAPLIDLIIAEIGKISRTFHQSEGKWPRKIIFGGGSALLPGLREYVGYQLKEEIVVANPFDALFYPSILEKQLEEMRPSWVVAVGAAMRGLE